MKELLGGFNDIITHGKGLHDTCNCNYSDVCTMPSNVKLNVLPIRCNAHHKTYVGLIDLWTSIVCPQPMDAKWHMKECIVGELCTMWCTQACSMSYWVNFYCTGQVAQYR